MAGHFPEFCKKSVQAQAADTGEVITEELLARTPLHELQFFSSSAMERLGRLAFTIAGRARVDRSEDGVFRLQGDGRDSRIGASVNAALEARLYAASPEATEVNVTAELQFSGRLGELGQPLIRHKADAMLEEFTVNMQQAIAERTRSSAR